jgi:hypothetical protein
MASAAVEKMLKEIYADSRVSPMEVMRLRNEVEQAEQRILQAEGMEGTMSALCKSFDVTNQLMQDSLLQLKKGDYSDMGREMFKAMLEANLALLKANMDVFAE